MKKLLILSALLLLSGCDSLIDLNSDRFEAGAAGIEQFGYDDETCKAQGHAYVDTDPRGMSDSLYARHRNFNRIYAGCMRVHGHAPRAYWKNVLQ